MMTQYIFSRRNVDGFSLDKREEHSSACKITLGYQVLPRVPHGAKSPSSAVRRQNFFAVWQSGPKFMFHNALRFRLLRCIYSRIRLVGSATLQQIDRSRCSVPWCMAPAKSWLWWARCKLKYRTLRWCASVALLTINSTACEKYKTSSWHRFPPDYCFVNTGLRCYLVLWTALGNRRYSVRVCRRPRLVIGICLVVTLVCSLGLFRVQIITNPDLIWVRTGDEHVLVPGSLEV